MLGLAACAVGASVFIFWGPKLNRKYNKKGALWGLENLGLTCFLNSLLQALASCPFFVDWLLPCEDFGNISNALYSLLCNLSYEKRRTDGLDYLSPVILISHLRGKGWPLFPQEHDPHELFLNIVQNLEEEETKSRVGREASLLDFLQQEHKKEEPSIASSHGDVPSKRKHVNEKPKKPRCPPSPFRGYLASQLKCLECGNKSPVMYDKFDSLTLALPLRRGSFTLNQLLDNFVKTELLDGFQCEFCNKMKPAESPLVKSRASKAIKIGKLPKCLCLHISRTVMDERGIMFKRDNYIDFPEYLTMGHYTHTTSMLKEVREKQMSESLINGNGHVKSNPSETSDGYKLSPLESVINSMLKESSPDQASPTSNNNMQTLKVKKTKHDSYLRNIGPVYRLKAVIEHRGSVESGHFVTYRKGPRESNIRHRSSETYQPSVESRWYLTSDEMVVPSTLCEALQSTAYLIFYEKASF